MKIIEIINRTLFWIERSFIVSLLLVMVTLAFLQVILRNFFSYGFLWADPLLRYTVLWVGFLGAVIATREGKHFGVDFLNRYLSSRLRKVVKLIIDSFAAVVAFLLMQAAFEFISEAINASETDLFGIPKRLYFAIIPVGFGLISLQFLFNIIYGFRDLILLQTNKKAVEPPHTFF